MHSSLLATALLSLASLGAQTAPCFSMNDANNTVSNLIYSSSFAGPNVNAWQITPAAPLVVQSLRILTGNNYPSTGPSMSLAIWDENPATSLPGTRLGTGSWATVRPNHWQGCNLDAVVAMQPSTNYWIVFTEPGWSTVPIEPNGIPMNQARLSSGVWTSASTGALKLRLYCGLLDDLDLTPSGSACNAAAGGAGTVFTNDTPMLGNTSFYVEGSGFPGNTLALLLLGLNPNWVSFPLPGGDPSCMLSTDPLTVITGFTGIGDVRAATTLGHVPYPLGIPNINSLVGLNVIVQIAALDPASTYGVPLMTSNALRITVY